MLVLTRKINEKLVINGNIKVVILEANKNSVRIGIDAPPEVQIYREEIFTEIQAANKKSNKIDVNDVAELNKIAPKTVVKKKFDLASKLKK